MPTRLERAEGALLGLAMGDAIGFPALFHIQSLLPERRQRFIWRTNARSNEQRITRIAVPFTHRLPEDLVAIGPTDDTEFALLTARILLSSDDPVTPDTFADGWRRLVLPHADDVYTGFAERAAIDNLRRGLDPPETGGDNPQHYDDSACARAVSIGIAFAGQPEQAAQIAEWDAQVTHAEDGIWAARAMAVGVALLVDGADLTTALARARAEFPSHTWIAFMADRARASSANASTAIELALLLSQNVIGGIYSYGTAAPETVPAAFEMAQLAGDDPVCAMTTANTIARAAESLPALVGALAGAYAGSGSIPRQWCDVLSTARGVCLPFLRGMRLADTAKALLER
jgi:ADP-ribosylglycohydrolase